MINPSNSVVLPLNADEILKPRTIIDDVPENYNIGFTAVLSSLNGKSTYLINNKNINEVVTSVSVIIENGLFANPYVPHKFASRESVHRKTLVCPFILFFQ